MTPEEIRAQLATIIAGKVNSRTSFQQIQWDTRLRDDLGLDSLALAELMYEIEDTFGTTLEETDPTTLLTIRDAVNAIARELQMPMAS
ncbi:MAG TPA: acyl carrier protein [Polyangia bacterium]